MDVLAAEDIPLPPGRGRRGDKKAILAVASANPVAAYHMLKTGTPYRDLGPNHFEPTSPQLPG